MSENVPSVKEKLEAITSCLLQADSSPQKKEILLNGLYDLLSTNKTVKSAAAQQERTEPKHGVAISAAERGCRLDERRTLVFLQGIFEAIQDLKKEFNEPLHILYAGCGPMGALVIPLLPLFRPADVRIYLLDRHPRAMRSVQQVIRESELGDYIEEFITADATTYKPADDRKFHMVVSENMDAGLLAESQFAITRNLHTLLAPGGKFLPEAIHLDVFLTRYEREPKIHHHTFTKENYIHKEWCEEKRTYVAHLFRLSKETFTNGPEVFANNDEEYIVLPTISIPALSEKDRSDMTLFTSVIVYGEHSLLTGEAAITSPVFLFTVTEAHEGRPLIFHYVINRFPRVGFEIG